MNEITSDKKLRDYAIRIMCDRKIVERVIELIRRTTRETKKRIIEIEIPMLNSLDTEKKEIYSSLD